MAATTISTLCLDAGFMPGLFLCLHAWLELDDHFRGTSYLSNFSNITTRRDLELDEIISPEMRLAVRKTLAMNDAITAHEEKMKQYREEREKQVGARMPPLLSSLGLVGWLVGWLAQRMVGQVGRMQVGWALQGCNTPLLVG